MELLSFFQKLSNNGIKLVLKDGSLRINSNTDIASDLLEEIKNNKEAIIQYLEKYQSKNTTNELLEKVTVYDRNTIKNIPLSFSQERLWFLDQLEGSIAYHIPIFLQINGGLDLAVLEKSFRNIISRHEVLRTVIHSESGIGYQEIINPDDWKLDHIALDKETPIKKVLNEYLKTPFDLSKDYMFRACIYELGNQEYVLAGIFHHIASDGWSQGILVKEFTEMYNALIEYRPAVLPELPLQYADYAIWQRTYLDKEVLEHQLSYWEERLSNISPLSIPTDYTRPSIQSHEGSRVYLSLSQELSSSIKELCEKEGVTLFMTLLSAFKILLSRYSGQSDVCVGTPIANRTQSELEGLIGFFVNTLVLRSDVNDDLSFQEFLSQVRHTTLSAYDHQLVPLEKIVDRVVETRDISMNSLFQVLFVLQNTPGKADLELEGIKVSSYEYQTSTSQLDLTLNAEESDSGILLDMEYCTALFDKRTVENMLLHYQELLQNIIKNSTLSIKSLSILTAKEEHQLLHEFNDTAVDYPLEKTLVDLFGEQVIKTPEAEAIVFEGEAMIYSELDKRSNQLAHYLIESGVVRDSLVGICIERSLDMLVGIMGILKAGGAYVPIDPQYPQERISYIIEDADIRLLLSTRSSFSVIKDDERLTTILLDRDRELINKASTVDVSRVSQAENLAYVIYTSGSTGKPKGVMNEHRGVVNRLLWTQSNYELTSEDAIVQKTSFCFDVSVWELFWPIISGCKLVFAKPEGHKDARYLKGLIETHNITTIHFVPSMLRAFLNEISLGDCHSLQRVLCSGEALHVDQVMAFREKFTGVQLDNLYGPTEAAIDVSWWEVPLTGDLTKVLIGKPVANTSLYVVDGQDQLLPIGVVGELCIGGVQVARGYRNKESLTQEKFIANPFKAGDRIYKTGDLARWLPDGTIEYIGRKDDQVKIRGYRIELGEIENTLSVIQGIKSCCVLAKEDVQGNKRLVGYVVVEGALDKQFIQNELQVTLPEYMVPQLWVALDSMPLTSNGKLNKKSLPEPDGTQLSTKVYVAARNTTEAQLVEIWQALLGLDKIGIHDNFFELGGHSLLVTQLISKLQAYDYQVEVKDVFASPTIEELALKLSSVSLAYQVPANGITLDCEEITPAMVPLVNFSQKELDKIVSMIPGGTSNIQDIYPLSPLQEGMYFHYLMSNSSVGDPYILQSLLSFDTLDKRSQFIETFKYIVSRHDVLRSCVLSEGLPHTVQVVLRDVAVEVETLSFETSTDVLEELESIMNHGNHWMDLSKTPLSHLKTAEDATTGNYYLLIQQHHIMIDHVGLEKVVREIMQYLYEGASSLAVPVLYRDFVAHTLHQQATNDSESYFRSRLETIEEPTFPFGLSNTLGDGKNIKESSVILSDDLSNKLRHVCRTFQISPAVLFHAAYGLVIGRCSNKAYAVFGSLFSGRLQGSLGADQSLGLFINTLPIILNLEGTVAGYVNQVNKELQGLLPYEQTSLSHIQHWSGIPNDMPLFSALLNYRHSKPSTEAPDSGITFIAAKERTNYPFDLNVDDLGEGFGLNTQVDGSIDSDRILSYMEIALKELIDGLESQEDVLVDSLNILPEKEKIELLETFNTTDVDYPLDKTFVDLFKKQVIKTPEAIAVEFEGEKLTYKTLDFQSNQLAHYLVAQGVGRDVLVGICLERSTCMLVGILGILKAGGAYVPIKPDYPSSRISHIVKDTVCSIVLTDELTKNSLEFLEEVTLLVLDGDKSAYQDFYGDALEVEVFPTSLSYVIYTSGSTGVPKGVMIEHNGLLNHLLVMVDELDMDKDSVVAFTAPFTFDISVWQLLSSLLTGGRVIIYEETLLLSMHAFESRLVIDGITLLQLVPSYLSSLLDTISTESLKGLHYFLVTGEAVSHSLLNRWFTMYPDIPVVNAYGPAEASDDVSLHIMHEEPVGSMVPIGKPVANMRLYIVDDYSNLCPIGATGELWVGGVGVGRGYLKAPEKTAHSFITNPFRLGERLYKTGDLGRWLPNGTLEFIGRKDDQVKIRGYRIELGEIDNVLSGHPLINSCCVLSIEDRKGSNRLVGYVETAEGLKKDALQVYLQDRIPEYMVPGLWVFLNEMPLTSNGKIDKKSLPSPDISGMSSIEYVAPQNETEEILVRIWQDLLGLEKIGIHDNFFELGGHSLLIVQLISRLQDENLQLEVRDIFSSPTISELSIKLISPSSSYVYEVPTNGINKDCSVITPSMVPLLDFSQTDLNKIISSIPGGVSNIQDIYPLSPLQEGMYFHHLMSDRQSGDPYIILGLLSFNNLEERTNFIEAFNYIITRHDVLRSCVLNSGLPHAVQVVLREVSIDIDKLTFTASQDVLEELKIFMNSGRHWIDLTKAPLLQLHVAEDIEKESYYLLVRYHHVMLDHVGLEKIVGEINQYLSGSFSGLPEPVLYRDFVAHTLHQQVINDSESYFRSRLGAIEESSYPFELSDALGDGTNIIESSIVLPRILSENLRKVSRDFRITPAVLFHAAYGLVVGRCSNKNYAVFGTLLSGRLQGSLGADQSLGLFINTLPLVLQLEGTLKTYLLTVDKELQGILPYEQTPLSHVQHWSGIPNDVPLFSALLNYRHSVLEEESDSGIKVIEAQERTNYPFDLSVDDYGKDFGLTAHVDHSISPSRITSYMEAVLQQFVEVLNGEEDVLVDSLNMLPEKEKIELLETFNTTDVDYPLDKTFVDLFKEQVIKTPEAIAVEFEGESLTYKALDFQSNQLAHYLVKEGVCKDVLVGICLERSTNMLVGILGILKAGGAYVPIKPDYPSNRMSHIVKDTSCPIILTDDLTKDSLEFLEDVTLLVLDGDTCIYQDLSGDAMEVVISPSSLSYVIYTSGSTGVPKGAMIEHKGLLNHLLVMVDELDMNKDSVVAFTAPFTFDISVWQLLSSLLTGGRVVIYEETLLLSMHAFESRLVTDGVTLLQLVPSYISSLLDTISTESLKRLHYFLVTGEAASHSLLKRWFTMYPDIPVVNAYGPAEASDDVSLHIMHEVPEGSMVPIGKPVANMRLYVVDDYSNVCPIGVTGELWVGGVGVGRGYLKDPEKTAHSFIPNPFRSGERLYKTGDLARWLPNGTLEFIGRKDDQVKIRGYRIELGEIDNVLLGHPLINSCCVLSIEDRIGSNRLVGYVETEEGLEKATLQEYLQDRLPEYMVPGLWVFLNEMPLTSNGKIDKKSLPSPDVSSMSSIEYVAPQNKTEEALVKIWQNLLGVEKIGIHDNFFELGGHSLLATRLVSMIRTDMNIEISIRDIFTHTTISALGVHLSTQSDGVFLPAITVQQRPDVIPLSFSQERLWFLDQLEGSVAYHIPVILRLRGILDISILEDCFRTIVSRHEVLRTMIYANSGVGYQRVKDSESWCLDHKILDSEDVLENCLEAYLSSPFDLSMDYKLRSCVYELGDQEYALACVFHHIASDGWSEDLLIEEFTELYTAFIEGRDYVLPELRLQYADYSIWQRNYIDGAVLESQLSYWENKLGGVSNLLLPTDYARPSVQSHKGSSISFRLEDHLIASIKELCQQEGVTVFMLLLSAFKVLLSRYSGQQDICIGTSIANRTQSELEGMIGFFVNTLALRSGVDSHQSFKALLSQVKDTTLSGYDHQLVPFEKVVDRVVDTRDMSMSPLFQVMFDLQNTAESSKAGVDLKDVNISSYEYTGTTSQFDLTLNAEEGDSGFFLTMEYCTDLFYKSTIERMLIHYQELLTSILEDATQEVGSLSMLTSQEEHQLIATFNKTAVDYPLDKTFVDLFKEQVVSTPEAIAVEFEGESLTYKALDFQSNQLAHYLVKEGVCKDVLVGICLERSTNMLVGILGILKAGGAYVPIKPDYPSNRMSHIVKDTSCPIILTDDLTKDSLEFLEDVALLVLDGDTCIYQDLSGDAMEVVISPSSLSYVIYTSGSTGVPKGAMIEHNGLLNHLLVMVDELDMNKDSVVAFTAPFTFDISVWQLLSSLLTGGRVVIYEETLLLSMRAFESRLVIDSVTLLQLVPSYISSFLDTISIESLKGLHYFLVTGEAVSHSLLNRWFTMYPNIPVVNAYGPAEASDDVSLHIMHEVPEGSMVPIGKPVANMRLYVVDDYSNVCPIGVTGELWVGGVGVGRGYLKDPEKTAHSFITNPFKSGERLYKTGDLARWLPNGTLEFIGRKDDQVKIRGYRIELGEIDNVLSGHPLINSCCVLSIEDRIGSNRLVGYVETEEGLEKATLQEYLQDRLPEYMVPGLWVFLNEMPLTSNGKIDKKSLPSPDISSMSSIEYVAPQNETEKALVKIWQDLLGVEKIGIHDNFFELGGHSLLATRLVSMIQTDMNIETLIRDIFEFDTIEELASHLEFVEMDFDQNENEENYNVTIEL